MASLQVDVFRLICDFLYQSDQSAFGRLCICSRNAREDSVVSLSKVEIDFSTHLDASFHAGASPQTVSVTGVPADEKQVLALGSVLSRAKEVSFTLGDLSDHNLAPLSILAPFLSSVEHLDIDIEGEPDLTNVLSSWFAESKNLTRLEINCAGNRSVEFLAAASVCPKLELLRLKPDTQSYVISLSALTESLNRIKSLKSLVLSQICLELGMLRIRVLGGNVDHVKQELDKFTVALPDALKSLQNVYVRPEERIALDIHLFGFLFASASGKAASELFLSKLKQVGVDNVCHEYGDTALVYLLASKPEEDLNEDCNKIEMLLDAGADPLHRGAVMSLLGGGLAWGNVLHAAAIFGESERVTDLLSALAAREIFIEPSKLRTSEGFTPLHFAGMSSDTWIAMSDFLKHRISPEILFDTENILGASPLLAIHRRLDPTSVSVAAVAEITEFIMHNEPWSQNSTIKRELAALFPTALDFYAACLGTQPAQASEDEFDEIDAENDNNAYPKEEIALLMRKIIAHYSGQRFTTPGASLPTAAKRISAAFILCPDTTRDSIISESSQQEISACLVAICSMSEAGSDVLSVAIPHLLKAGASAIFTHNDICNGFTSLGAFVATHTPLEENIVDEEWYHWEADCKKFWTLFWQLVAAGAPPRNGDGSSIFESDEFGQLLRREDQLAEVQKLRNWLMSHGTEKDREALTACLEFKQEDNFGAAEDGDDEDDEPEEDE